MRKKLKILERCLQTNVIFKLETKIILFLNFNVLTINELLLRSRFSPLAIVHTCLIFLRNQLDIERVAFG